MPPSKDTTQTTILRKKKLRSSVIKKTIQAFLKTANTNSHHNTIRKLIPMIYYTIMKQISVKTVKNESTLPQKIWVKCVCVCDEAVDL